MKNKVFSPIGFKKPFSTQVLLLFCASLVSFLPVFGQDLLVKGNPFGKHISYVKKTKLSEQYFNVYAGGKYSFYHFNNKGLKFDTGTIKIRAIDKKIVCKSIASSHSFNPLIAGNYQMTDEYILDKNNNKKITFRQIPMDSLLVKMLLYDGQKFVKTQQPNGGNIHRNGELDVRVNIYRGELDSMIKLPNQSSFTDGQLAAESEFMTLKKYKNFLDPEYKEIYSLAKSICQGLQDDSLKVLKICQWMVKEFNYDYDGPVRPDLVLKEKRTVCAGYASFFVEMCKAVGVPCIYVVGLADNGSQERYDLEDKSNHAWNIVKIKGIWRHVDVTWLDPIGAGQKEVTGKSFYFLTPPEKMINDHFPENAAYKFTNMGPSSVSESAKSPVVYQQGFDCQFLGPNNNIIIPLVNNLIEFYIYAKEAMTGTLVITNLNSERIEDNIAVNLKAGINKISFFAPSKLKEIKFNSPLLNLVFLVAPVNGQKSLIRYHSETAIGYDKLFYDFILSLPSNAEFPLKNDIDSNFNDQRAWKNIISKYNGRSPLGCWYINDGEVFMRFYFTNEKLNGKKVFVECKVYCTQSQVRMINPVVFAVGPMYFDVEYFW